MNIRAFLVFLLMVSVGVAAPAKEEIESLLGYVGALDAAKFIRNGSSYPASAAVSHMRLKWEKQTKKIVTAEDFIALCGSKSSTTGERYQIKFKDGSERFCDDVLSQQLRAIRQTANQPPEPTPQSGVAQH
jgi:hypothetical protein